MSLNASPAAEAATAAGLMVDAGMTETVVGRALVLVGQHLVGLLGLLEMRFRIRVAGIAVGMMLHGEAPIRLLDVGLGGVARRRPSTS